MDKSVLGHSNLIAIYGIDIRDTQGAMEQNLRNVRASINRLVQMRLIRIDGEIRKCTDEAQKAELIKKARGLKAEFDALKTNNNLYELLFYYIHNAYDEYVFSIKQKYSKEEQKEKIEAYTYVYEQLTSPEDIKEYLEVLLPLIKVVDFDSIASIKDKVATSKIRHNDFSYAVEMYRTPQMLLDRADDSEAMRVYSFGTFKYKTEMIGESLPYEILGIVKKLPDGTTKSIPAIMYLSGYTELEFQNIGVDNKTRKESDLRILSKTTSDGKASIICKRGVVRIPEEQMEFIRNIVFSDYMLSNAQENTNHFVGRIVKDEATQSRYGNYKLTFDQFDIEELLMALRYAEKYPGHLYGVDGKFYGNNLQGALLMVKYACLAVSEKMKCLEKEKGFTQGEE